MSEALQRQDIEAIVERLIDMLDCMDGDPDFEPDADSEPWLGWTTTGTFGKSDDREWDVLEEDAGATS